MRLPSPESTFALISSRRTVQLFEPDPVSDSVITKAIEAGCWAPNHRRTYPWRYYLIGAETKGRIVAINTELTRAARGDRAAELKHDRWSRIPGWLVVTSVGSDDPLRDREDYAACCCAVQNMMLYLSSAGIGSKWTTGDVVRTPEFRSVVGMEEHERVVALVWYGRSAEEPPAVREPAERFVRRTA